LSEPKLAGEASKRRLVDLTSVSWNRIQVWLDRLDALRQAA
jgi:hypothetical protein